MQSYTFFGKWHQITLKNVTQDSDYVWAKSGLLSELHCTYSNNLLVINGDIPHKSLLQRELSFAQQSVTYRDFNIILFALSIATVSNEAR